MTRSALTAAAPAWIVAAASNSLSERRRRRVFCELLDGNCSASTSNCSSRRSRNFVSTKNSSQVHKIPSGQDDADLLFGRKLPTRDAADLLDDLLCRFLLRPGFLSHLRSPQWLRWAKTPPFLNSPDLSHSC